MSNLSKSLFLGFFSGIIAYGVNAGMDHWNERELDFTLYLINFILWFLIMGFGSFYQLKKKN